MLICSANSTLTSLDVSDNPMNDAARKAIEVEFVLCQIRNPKISKIDASDKGFDDQDAIKIGEGLRSVLLWCLLFYTEILFRTNNTFLRRRQSIFRCCS